MDKSVVGLVSGAALALAGASAPLAANAAAIDAQTGLPPARSFADLLEPVPNAAATLKAVETKADGESQSAIEMAQYYYPRYHHHHHHHHHHWRWHHHHHHHYYHHHHHHYY